MRPVFYKSTFKCDHFYLCPIGVGSHLKYSGNVSSREWVNFVPTLSTVLGWLSSKEEPSLNVTLSSHISILANQFVKNHPNYEY